MLRQDNTQAVGYIDKTDPRQHTGYGLCRQDSTQAMGYVDKTDPKIVKTRQHTGCGLLNHVIN